MWILLTAAGILGLLSVAFAMFPAVFAWAIAFGFQKVAAWEKAALACALSPFLWVALEYARTHLILGGFPWNLTGYAASASLGLLQLAAMTGIYGLSFLVAAYSSLVAYAILAGRQVVWKITLVTTGALILVGRRRQIFRAGRRSSSRRQFSPNGFSSIGGISRELDADPHERTHSTQTHQRLCRAGIGRASEPCGVAGGSRAIQLPGSDVHAACAANRARIGR